MHFQSVLLSKLLSDLLLPNCQVKSAANRLCKLGQDLIYSSKTENLAVFESRSNVLHSHQAGNPQGQQILQAPNTTQFISGDQWQPYEVQ